MLDEIYIGEPNLIYCEIEGVSGATVTFTITLATITDVDDVAANAIGTAGVTMSYNATTARYEGTLSAANASLLAEYDPEEDNAYHVWIQASNYTLRRLRRKAVYRERT